MKASKINLKVVFFAASVFGLLSFVRRWFDQLADAGSDPWPTILFDEISAAWLGALIILPMVRLVMNKPPWRWPHLLLLLPLAGLFAVLHTTALFVSRKLAYPLLGFGDYEYGNLAYRYVMEAPIQWMIFAVVMLLLFVIDQGAKARETERLKTLLAQTQLEGLKLQLAPHFLFNTLNAISDKVYQSAEQADEMIGRLSELLRSMLLSVDQKQVTLREELNWINEYIAIQSMRFEVKLDYKQAIDAAHLQLHVPPLILQPLVENVFKHGANHQGQVAMTLRSELIDNCLKITISNRGADTERRFVKDGIGLKTTKQRLAILYPGKDLLHHQVSADGVIRVILEVPQ